MGKCVCVVRWRERELDEATEAMTGHLSLIGNKWWQERESEIVQFYGSRWNKGTDNWRLKIKKCTWNINQFIYRRSRGSNEWKWMGSQDSATKSKGRKQSKKERNSLSLSLELKAVILHLLGTVMQCCWIWVWGSDIYTYRLQFWLYHYMVLDKSFHFCKPFFSPVKWM